ncbi:BPSL0761 family protein [Variovorax sp. J31P207]|uniref:BPSL0761 family protein n=1 Tax=Variovorax sp. J31P207 TaxID=3053510 RepID=UPI0033656874
MTVPSERTRAVVETRKFLCLLARSRMAQESPAALQRYAEALLRSLSQQQRHAPHVLRISCLVVIPR